MKSYFQTVALCLVILFPSFETLAQDCSEPRSLPFKERLWCLFGKPEARTPGVFRPASLNGQPKIQSAEIDLTRVTNNSGHAYFISHNFGTASDTNIDGQFNRSKLRIFENGVEMGPAHSLHKDIREEGSGRFSHWKTALYFSATDNSDPRTNGRIYTYSIEEGDVSSSVPVSTTTTSLSPASPLSVVMTTTTLPPVIPETTTTTILSTPPPTTVPSGRFGSYSVPAQGPLKVFPGAEGFGTDTPAGRGGQICKVTDLSDSGAPGSLRYCAETLSGRRMVIFEVGGVIRLDKKIDIKNPNISIYGQTAPGDGIVLTSGPKLDDSLIIVSADNVLVQHLRLRMGESTLYGSSRDTGVSCCNDTLTITGAKNVVIDHNSMSWSTDEIAGTWYTVNNITWSHNIFSEGLHDAGVNSQGPAGRGLLIGVGVESGNISLHHNYIASSYQRNPAIDVGGLVDIVNNLIYRAETREGQHNGESGGTANWVKNKWIAGPESSTGWGGIQLRNPFPRMAYFEDNIGIYRRNNSEPQWAAAATNYNEPYNPSLGYHSETRFSAPPVTEYEVDSLEDMLLPTVGAFLPRRDSVDRRLMEEFRTGRGQVPDCISSSHRGGSAGCGRNVGGFPSYSGGPAPRDSDGDGIPDSWEAANGLNPEIADSLEDSNGDGYLNIEDWVHSIQ